jgi:hypothetical protein
MWRNGSNEAAVSYYQYMKQHKKSIVFFVNKEDPGMHNGIQLLTKIAQNSMKMLLNSSPPN